jgi:hypothetical protein
LSSGLLSRNLKIKIYKNIILPLVLYGCKTWSLTLREEHTLRTFQNRVLRRISEPKKEEVAGGWRRLSYEELHNLYASQNIIKVIKSRSIRWARYVAHMKEINAYKILVGKFEGNSFLRETFWNALHCHEPGYLSQYSD